VHDGAFDTAVIGAGIGGVVAAALLARRGQRVLLLEKNDEPGGYFAGVRAGDGSRFDRGIIFLSGCAEGGPLLDLLDELGAAPPALLAPDPLGMAWGPGYRVALVPGERGMLAALDAAFPGEAPALEEHLAMCRTVAGELDAAASGRGASPHVARLAASTHQGVIESRFHQPGLRQFFLDQPFFLFGRRDSALLPALRLWSLLQGDMHLVAGGARALVDALMGCFLRDGGEFWPRCPAVAVTVTAGRAAAVDTGTGRHIQCANVVAGIDVRELLLGLCDQPPGAATRVRLAAEVAPSAVVQYLNVTGDPLAGLGVAGPYLSLLGPADDDAGFALPGAGVAALRLPPAGEKTCRVIVETRAAWPGDDDTVGGLRSAAAGVVAAAGARVLASDLATPADFHRLTGNARGSTMGWAFTPRNMTVDWFNPLPGLYVVSHWAGPWSGLLGGLRYGRRAADVITGEGRGRLGQG